VIGVRNKLATEIGALLIPLLGIDVALDEHGECTPADVLLGEGL
jgi:hypothetical protein